MIAPPKQSRNSYSRKKHSSATKTSRLRLWCVLGIAVVAMLATILSLKDGGKESGAEMPKQTNKKTIKEKKPSLRTRTMETEKPIEVAPKVEPVSEPPVGNVMTARTAKVGRVMTLMDGTVVTNKVKRPFKRDLEHSLWVALRPGNMGAGLLSTLQNRHSDEEIIAMLKEMTVPEDGDSEGMIRIKAEVQDLKERILLALDSGRTLSDVFGEIRNQGIMESKLKAETMRMRAEAIRSGDPEQVRETIRKTNELRAKNGLEPLSVPAEFQLPEEDATAKQTYTEFDEEE